MDLDHLIRNLGSAGLTLLFNSVVLINQDECVDCLNSPVLVRIELQILSQFPCPLHPFFYPIHHNLRSPQPQHLISRIIILKYKIQMKVQNKKY